MQSLLEFISLAEQHLVDSLLHDTANIVIKQTEVTAVRATDPERSNLLICLFVHFNAYYVYYVFHG